MRSHSRAAAVTWPASGSACFREEEHMPFMTDRVIRRYVTELLDRRALRKCNPFCMRDGG
jgi:hypothetical protein